MEREPGEIRPSAPDEGPDAINVDALSVWLEALPPCPGILHADEESAEEAARIEADLAAGRVYPHGIVAEWLETWGKADRKPFKEWLKSSG